MPSIITSGFILKKNHFKDADRIVVIFSEKLGKITALGKFAKKSIKRNLNLLDYGLLLKFYLQSTTTGHYLFINKVELLDKLLNSDNLTLFSLNSYINELISNVVYSNEDSKKIFDLTVDFIKKIKKLKQLNIQSAIIIYQMKLLKLLGYGLNISKCHICGNHKNIENYSLENLAFICNKCNRKNFLQLCKGSLKLIQNIDKIDFANINLSQQIIKEQEMIFFANLRNFLSENRLNKITALYSLLKNGI